MCSYSKFIVIKNSDADYTLVEFSECDCPKIDYILLEQATCIAQLEVSSVSTEKMIM